MMVEDRYNTSIVCFGEDLTTPKNVSWFRVLLKMVFLYIELIAVDHWRQMN
jgi:hypothetical protein